MSNQQPKCIFCRIAAGEIPSTFLYEDEQLFVIRDIAPQAATHLLAIPRRHVSSIIATTDADSALAGALINQLRVVASTLGLTTGYRLVINNGPDAGQEVDHLHVHLLGGEKLQPMTGGRK